MPKKWNEVIQSEGFVSLTDEDKISAKEQYFNDIVMPQLSEEDVDNARSQFYSSTEGPSRDLSRIDPELGKREIEDVITGGRKYGVKTLYSLDRFVGQFKEGVKDIARGTTTGALALGLSSTDMNELQAREDVLWTARGYGAHTGLSIMDRKDILSQRKNAEEKLGRELSVDEYNNIKVNYVRNRNLTDNKQIQKSIGYIQEQLKADPEYLKSAGFFEDVVRMAPQVAGQIITAVATGGIGGVAFMGLHITGATYEDLINKGVAPERAVRAGLANAIMQAPLESIGISKAMKFFKLKGAIAGKLKKLGAAMGTEWLTEFLQAHPEALTAIWGGQTIPKKNLEMFNEYLDGWWETTKQGAYEGTVAMVFPGAGGAVKIGANIVVPSDPLGKFKTEEEKNARAKEILAKRVTDSNISEEEKEHLRQQIAEIDTVKSIEEIAKEPKQEMAPTLDEGMEQEKVKYEEILGQDAKDAEQEIDQEVADAIEETPEEIKQEEVAEPGIKEKKEKPTPKKKLVSKQEDIKLTVPKIKEISDPTRIDEIIKTYKGIDQKSMNQHQIARLNAAKVRKTELKPVDKVKEPTLEIITNIDKSEAKIVPQYKGTSLQGVAKDQVVRKDGTGSVFQRSVAYEKARQQTIINPTYLSRNEQKAVKEIEKVERRIAKGTWKFQFLLDDAIKRSPNLTLSIMKPTNEEWLGVTNEAISADRSVRGASRTTSQGGKVRRQIISLNPVGLGRWNIDSESILVHEILHTSYRNTVGVPTLSVHPDQQILFGKEIKNIFDSIDIAKLSSLIDIGKTLFTPEFTKMNPEQRREVEAWATFGQAYTAAINNPADPKKWEELIVQAMSEHTIMSALYQIKSPSGKDKSTKHDNSIGRRIVKAILKLINLTKSQTIMDDLLDTHNKFMADVAIKTQNYANVPPGSAWDTAYSMDLRPFKNNFPKGAAVLKPAIQEDNGNIWWSDIAHFDITDADGNPRIGTEGFVALDESGRQELGFYTREEAGRRVDPNRRVIDPDSGAMASEDMKYIELDEQHSKTTDEPIFKRDGKGNIKPVKPGVVTTEQVRRKTKLTEQDKEAILNSFKKKFRGQTEEDVRTPREKWADVRKVNQAAAAAMKRELKPEVTRTPREKDVMWEKWRPTDNLVNLTDYALEQERNRVTGQLSTRYGLEAEDHPGRRYYELRLRAIDIQFRKKARSNLVKAQAEQEALQRKAGSTVLQNLRFYKAEWKSGVRNNAPYQHMNFIRGELINLMGPESFYRWSGETPPVITKRKEKEKEGGKKLIATKKETIKPTSIKKEGEVEVKVYEPYTEEDAKKGGFKVKGAKSTQEARDIYDDTIGRFQSVYLNTGESISEDIQDEYVEGLTLAITQALKFKVIDEAQAKSDINKITGVLTGIDSSYENVEYSATDPNQAKFDKWASVKVKFDGYRAPHEGYVPSGFAFTVIDKDSTAYGASLSVPVLDKANVERAIKFLEDSRKPPVTLTEDNSATWNKVEDSKVITTERAVINDHNYEIEFTHRIWGSYEQKDLDFLTSTKTPKIGHPFAEIIWSRDRIYERDEFTKDVRAAIGVIRHIRTMLTNALQGKYKADVPRGVYFSGSYFDDKKNTMYIKYIEKIAKELNWEFATRDDIMFAYDPEYVPTAEDIRNYEELDRWGYYQHDTPPIAGGDITAVKEELASLAGESFDSFRAPTSPRIYSFPADVFFRSEDNRTYDKIMLVHNADTNTIDILGNEINWDEFESLGSVSLNLKKTNWTTAVEKETKRLVDGVVYDNTIGAPTIEYLEPEMDLTALEDLSVTKHVYTDPQMEKQAQKGEQGIKDITWFQKVWDGIKDALTGLREFKYLKRKEYGDIQYALRQLKKAKAASSRHSVKILTDVLSNLNKNQYHNLKRLAYIMDLREQVEINEALDAAGQERTVTANPFGWSDSKIKQEAAALWDLVYNDEQTRTAWELRQDAWFNIRKSYSSAMDSVGFNVANKLQRIFYFRHQVLDYMQKEHERIGTSGSGKLAVPTGRSHLKPRGTATGYAMNLDFLQAEFEIMTQLLYDTQIAQTLDEIMTKYGSKEAREGYKQFSPREGAVFFTANTIPDQMLRDAIASGAKELTVSTEKLNTVLAMGGKYRGYYLPEKVSNTLNHALEERPSPTWSKVLFKAPMRYWKAWQLISPYRILKYNIRNMTGDAEAVFIGSPGVFKWAPKAIGDLWRWKIHNKISKNMQDWIDRGGQETTLQAQEFFEIMERPEFANLKTKEGKLRQLLRTGMKLPRSVTDFREMILRYAAYLKFKNEIDKNKGAPKKYVASLREEVDALKDNSDKAFMMSNDLLGAYDRVSQVGEGLRKYIAPFWSFQEVNLKRTVTMFNNAIRDDSVRAQVGRKLGAKTYVAAIKVGGLALKLLAFSVTVGLWNNMVMGDAEDGLPEDMRKRSHIILWPPNFIKSKEDPQIYYFPRIGVAGDLLEWAGLDTLPSNIVDLILRPEKNTWKEIVDSYDNGIKNWEDASNKAIQMIGPQFKMPIELFMGEKMFPSIWNRQPITDRWKWLFDNFQLGDYYDAVAGRPQRKEWLKRQLVTTAVYREDKKRLGWLAIQQQISDYKRKAGLKGRGFIVTDSGQALYNMGLSWRYGDMNTYIKYLKEYVDLTLNKYQRVDLHSVMNEQWEKLNPLEGLNETHQMLFFTSLNEKDRKALKLALQYYLEIKGGLQFIEKGGKE